MPSTKLTTVMRERIVADLLVHRFRKPADKLVKDRAAFALKLYREVYPRAVLTKMDALPEGWLPTNAEIRARLGTHYESFPFDGSLYGKVWTVASKTEAVWKRVRAQDAGGCLLSLEATHPLSLAGVDLDKRRNELATSIDAAKRQAESAVSGVTTIARLIELWPECEPFARKHETARAPLPALPTASLNALLDLPVAA